MAERLEAAGVQRLRIDHRTVYRFATPVVILPHRLLLRPRENHSVRITSSLLMTTPAHTIRWQRDAFDNSVAIVSFTGATTSLEITSQVSIEHYGAMPLDFIVEDYATHYPFSYTPEDTLRLSPLRELAWPHDRPAVSAFLQELGLLSGPLQTFSVLDTLNRQLSNTFRYQAREEPGVQSPATTLATRSGSCRDLAALFLDACRTLGIASRFVSGYHKSYAGEIGSGSTHAWAEAFLPGPGWTGFDPTAGIVTGSDHIAVAVARHPETVPPVAGSYLGPAEPVPFMHVSVQVHAV